MKALILDNKVVDTSEVEFEVHTDMTWVDCPDECKAGEWEVVGGNLQVIPEPEDTRTYSDFRRNEYPSIGDQLDMLFHAIEAGTLDTTSEFFTTLKAVKDANPKA